MTRPKLSLRASIAFSGNGGYAGISSLGDVVRKREKLSACIDSFNQVHLDRNVRLEGELSLVPGAIIAQLRAHSGIDADILFFLGWLDTKHPEVAENWRILGSEEIGIAPVDPDEATGQHAGDLRMEGGDSREGVDPLEDPLQTTEPAHGRERVGVGEDFSGVRPSSGGFAASDLSDPVVALEANDPQPSENEGCNAEQGTDAGGEGQRDVVETAGGESIEEEMQPLTATSGVCGSEFSLQVQERQEKDHESIWLDSQQQGLLIQGEHELIFIVVDDEKERAKLLASPASGTFRVAGVSLLVRYAEAED